MWPPPEVSVWTKTVPGAESGFAQKLEDQLRLTVGIRCGVELLETDALPRWDHKARRFKDERTEVPF